MTDLTTLQARVWAAEGADAKLFRQIGKAFGLSRDGEWWWRFERLIQAEAWTDAALALVEAKLPDCALAMIRGPENDWMVYTTRIYPDDRPRSDVLAEGASLLALATLAALLSALNAISEPRHG